jgi:hypothetical protein
MVKAGARGMALPMILFLLLALTVLAHGALMLSRQEQKASSAFVHTLRATRAAEAAARLGLTALVSPPASREAWKARPVVAGETEDGLQYHGVARWLDGEFFLLEGSGGSRGWEGEQRTGLVGWSLLPEARLGALGAGAEMGGHISLEGRGHMEMDSFFDPPGGWKETDCAPFQVVLDSLFPGGSIDVEGPLPDPEAAGEVFPGSIPPLGLLSGSRLLELATSGPLPDPNPPLGEPVWGCPKDGEPMFLGSLGSMTLTRGRVCGLLVVGEDLRLSGDVRFQGLALVGGDLVVEDQAVFEGMARLGGGLRISSDGAFLGSGCPVLWALEGVPGLQDPFFIDGNYLNGF